MRRVLVPILLATLGFASAANGAAVPAAPVAAIDMFTISDMKVEATARSPRAARDLAMLQGRPLAWTKLFRQVTVQAAWGSEPQLTDDQIQGLILTVDLGNERRNTTRYLADVMYHFNPAAVRALLRKSNISLTGSLSEPELVIPESPGIRAHLMANVRFDTLADWTSLVAQLGLVNGVTEIVVIGLALNEAQIDLAYVGELEQLQDALARKNRIW
jgi:hypothetical protein